MKLIVSVLVLVSVSAFAQNQMELQNLKKIQYRLDSLKLIQEEQLDKKIHTSIQKMKMENDSLKLAVELLNTELLLAQGKLRNSEMKLIEKSDPKENQIIVNPTKAISIQEAYYVVLDSERTLEEIEQKQSMLQRKFTNNELTVIQNESKTWYHLIVKKGYDRITIGLAVQAFRNKGIADAWWILNQ